MELAFSIHNIFNVLLTDVPKNIKSFLEGELAYFKVEDLEEVNLEINFVKEIELPESSITLLRDLFYKDGILYFSFSESILAFPIRDIHKDRIQVKSEKGIPELMVFYTIEKMLHLKILEKDYCLFHAACTEQEGKASIYSCLQRTGKTKLLLEKLENGANFISDDLVLVSPSGFAFCYPRRLNIHKYHGKYYHKVYQSLPKKVIIRESIRNSILSIFDFLLSQHILFYTKKRAYSTYGLRQRIKELRKKKRIFRLSIEEIFPEVKVIPKGKIDSINLVFKNNSGSFNRKWESTRVTNFLIRNTNHERLECVGPYIDAFWAFGDEYSVRAKGYIEALLEKEKRTVSQVIANCNVNIMFI